MAAKKILSYSRFILGAFLGIYLILVWMYFKDNARQLTSSGLLLWFVAIPLLLLGTIMALLWWQKKLDKQVSKNSDSLDDISNKTESAKQPDTYQVFIFSRVCLPEGDSWSEVIDNDEDLTLLSDELTDFDGLPILVKPITRLTDAASLPYQYISKDLEDADWDVDTSDEGESRSERIAALNDTTLRLCSLIHEQLTLSDEIWSVLAEHFYQHHQQDNMQSNSAAHIHPEWQQHYLVSAKEGNSDETMATTPTVRLSNLPIYLCLPVSADSASLISVVTEQLATYGIPEAALSFTTIATDDTDATSDRVSEATTANPAEFINRHIISLSQSAAPDICLMLIADSQISEEWLDSHLYSNQTANVIPTEAGALLVFFNKAAQDLLNIDTSTRVLLTEIDAPKANDRDKEGHTSNRLSNNRRYLNHLTTIQKLLIDNTLSLSPTNTAALNTVNKPTTKADDADSKTNVVLSDLNITAISDINPSNQPYDMSVYMNFLDAFIAQGALVNERHLGHYMPLNHWLKPFISLSLFVDLVENDQQESDSVFLITQHKNCTMLWLADTSQQSES
ncbi:hypothetical protein IPZ60_06490 [Psychrobacter sp. NG25]|uniref:hypothetical protein n=1 Tax=Psychrobacter sp. NG25 TaxID=2782005 RepID=UPI001883DB0B|nr:hypothetical protein [Psychrobacter sp. NG25]MBF0658384.1 hypothetical protein [Psychrobacter sp. NG25]